jgi:hypothetical protein
VPASDRERIFAPFTQLDASTTRRVGGVGLGLFLVDQLVRGDGGPRLGGGQPRAVAPASWPSCRTPRRGSLAPGNLPPGSAVQTGMRQTTLLRPLAGLLLAVALLAACADQDGGDGAASGGSGPTTTPETSPSQPPTTEPGSGGKREITATGTLRAGVEPGCMLLEADQGPTYLLVGGDRGQLREGERVQVSGQLAPDLLSTCQEGQPLLVRSIKPA